MLQGPLSPPRRPTVHAHWGQSKALSWPRTEAPPPSGISDQSGLHSVLPPFLSLTDWGPPCHLPSFNPCASPLCPQTAVACGSSQGLTGPAGTRVPTSRGTNPHPALSVIPRSLRPFSAGGCLPRPGRWTNRQRRALTWAGVPAPGRAPTRNACMWSPSQRICFPPISHPVLCLSGRNLLSPEIKALYSETQFLLL